MPKRSKDRIGTPRGIVFGSPQWTSRGRSLSYRLRQATHTVVGEAYDRAPCPHVERTRELLPDPFHPQDQTRLRVFVTDAPCVRPAGHVHATRVVPDKHGPGPTVPDDAARLHADDTGSVWS